MPAIARDLRQVFRTRSLRNVLLVCVLLVLAFPLADITLVYPLFAHALVSFTEMQAVRVAHRLAKTLDPVPVAISRDGLPVHFDAEAREVLAEQGLIKLKLYSPAGEVVFSTDASDVGQFNRSAHFREEVLAGRQYTQVVNKASRTLEGEISSADVVETYVPVRGSGGEIAGAFEIYYDISGRWGAVEALLRRSTLIVGVLALVLLAAVIVVLSRTGREMRERQAAEDALRASEQRFRLLTAWAEDGVLLMHEDGRPFFWNRAAQRLFGFGPGDQPGGAVWTYLVPARFREHFTSVLRRRREGGSAGDGQKPFEVEARTREGGRVVVEVSLAAVQLPEDLNVIGIFRDVSRRREMEARMAMAARVMETAMEGVMVTDPQAVIETVNPAFSELTGYSAEEAVGRPASLLKSGRHDEAFYAGLWKAISREGRWAGEIWNRRKSGEVFPELLQITAIRDEQGAISHFVGVFSDITHFKLNETRLEKLAYSDALTGLPNRIVLMDRLGRAVARARRDAESLAVYFLDLDGFKEVNDRFGHLNGDRLLQTIARRLVASVRDEDTVARLGGDEFALILRGAQADDPAAGTVADKLRQAVSEEPYALDGTSVRVTVSIGVSRYPQDGEDPELLLRRADEAMYRAKAEGKDRYRVYGA